jgi:RNA polymerase sigma factor (sigma-70 family)
VLYSGDKKSLLFNLHRLLAPKGERSPPDDDLLQRFVDQRDETAFRTLIHRYGPLVHRVCRRVLGETNDVDDAFQATFIVFASRAASIRRGSVAAWLHGVALRISHKARVASTRRRVHESNVPERVVPDVLEELTVREAGCLIEEELERMPEKYRVPLIECNLLGRKREVVAHQLGYSLSTLTRRLERGQTLLKRRLTARGVIIPTTLLAMMLSSATAEAAFPAALVSATLQAALLFASGQEAAAATSAATGLAKLAINGMLITQMRTRVVAIVLALILAGGGVGAWQAFAPKPDTGIPLSAPPSPDDALATRDGPPVARKKVAELDEPPKVAGPTVVVRGKVLDAAGRALPLATATALVRRPFRPGEQGLLDEVVARGQTDEEGVYRLRVPARFPTWFPERQVVLAISAPGHAPFTTIVPLPEQGTTDVDLRLTSAERVVRGRLLGPDGAAAPGVLLRIIRLGDLARETVQGEAEPEGQNLGWPGPVVSDAEGRFALRGIDPEQGVWLQVEDDRYAPDAFGLRGADKPAEIRLKPAQVLEGRILAADTGKPVAGVKLTAPLAPRSFNPARFTVPDYLSVSARALPPGSIDAVSGANGRFRLRWPGGGTTALEIHPPPDSPYLAVRKNVVWSEGVVQQTLAVALPRGVVVHGRVIDDDGRPVAGASVQFGCPGLGNAEYRPDVIQGRSRIVLAGKDGRFTLTAPAGPVQILAHGPTHEYLAHALRFWSELDSDEEPKRWGWREPLPENQHFYTHAEQELKLTLAENPPEVQLRLVRGQTVAGRVVDPDGAPIKTAVLLCGEKVSPVRNGALQPLPVRDGRYELPGCMAGRVYPVLFFDAVNGWGAAVDLAAGKDAAPEVKLAPCGSARVRLVDAKGGPVAGCAPQLFLLAGRSFSADKAPLKHEADPQFGWSYDPQHYSTDPVSDRDGWLVLPALIPGARYMLQYADVQGVFRLTPEFRVEPGKELQLPDLAVHDKQ